MLRKIAIWIVKNLFILLLITLIFSTAALDMPALVKGLFTDIFQYSSTEMQKEVVSKLTAACSGLDGKNVLDGFLPIDFKKIGGLCNEYNAGKINDKDFFFSVIGTAIPTQFELPKSSALEKYNSIMQILNKNKIIYFMVLAVLLLLLYLLVMEIKLFIMTLTGISFSMGILILFPYAAIIAYDKFVGIDTTPILSSILQGTFSLNIKAVISVILLMILRTYTSFIIVLGIVFLGIGFAGKFYRWKLRKQSKTIETKTEKKPEKETGKIKETKKEIDEDAYKKDRRKERTTKEILDELEEMHRKRMKEKEKD